jgi:hypothetical protein
MLTLVFPLALMSVLFYYFRALRSRRFFPFVVKCCFHVLQIFLRVVIICDILLSCIFFLFGLAVLVPSVSSSVNLGTELKLLLRARKNINTYMHTYILYDVHKD